MNHSLYEILAILLIKFWMLLSI